MDPTNPAPHVPASEAGAPSANGSTPGAASPSPSAPTATTVAAPAPSPSAPAAPMDPNLSSEVDAAMAALGLGPGGLAAHGTEGKGDRPPREGAAGGNRQRHQRERERTKNPITLPGHDIAPIGGAAKPAMKGPRVVQAGREYRTGKVVSVGPTDIFLEFGPKEIGVIPRAQFTDEDLPAKDAQLEVTVDRFEETEQIFLCSRPGAVVKAAWETLTIGQTVDAKVVAVNKGGLELEISGHKAFMPASQVSLDRIPDLSVLIGEKLTCQVSQLDKRGRGNIVLSRRDILEQERRERTKSLRDQLKEGDVLDGTVRKIMPFGAFVDIGGVDGLVHVSDLSHERVGMGEQAIAKHIKEGQKVKVKILKIEWNEEDMRKSRIGLGLKQLAQDPYQTALAEIKEGSEINGKIVSLQEFGAFVEIAPGVQGLVHVSEIAHKRINHPQDVLKIDEIVRAKVLKIDPGTRRISLSLKAMIAAPEYKSDGPGGGGGGRGGKGGKDRGPTRTTEEIMKETPALRRLRAQAAARDKAKGGQLKGGF